jgi:hypothetical protein
MERAQDGRQHPNNGTETWIESSVKREKRAQQWGQSGTRPAGALDDATQAQEQSAETSNHGITATAKRLNEEATAEVSNVEDEVESSGEKRKEERQDDQTRRN